MKRKFPPFELMVLLLAVLACNVLQPTAVPDQTPLPPSATPAGPRPATPTEQPASPTPAEPASPSATPTVAAGPAQPAPTPAPGATSFVAYLRAGHLLVTDVTGGVLGGTTQYTRAGVDDGVYDFVWSPSGQFIAFTSAASGVPHVYVVYAVGAGTPLDLGPGGQPGWSPDSTRLAYVNEDNLWLTDIEGAVPQPLTAQTNWAWGRPTFTPDGSALVVTGNSRDNLGAQGNTEFTPSLLPLDGSGTLTPLPGIDHPIGGRLPYDLQFSPDGQKLAFSTSFHLSACATQGQYYLANADGNDLRELYSPSLRALLSPGQETYPIGFGFAWTPESDALLLQGVVVNCSPDNPGQQLGAQLSLVDLAEQESLIVPGFFSAPSFDRTGALFAAARSADPASPGQVQIFSRAGEVVLEVGEGNGPRFQP
ncbi:MAG: PD40 domain-containing protein [Anaerolineales bacterium]|nr:PD40 domain-containing protein [Anaerolineales bacterium]